MTAPERSRLPRSLPRVEQIVMNLSFIVLVCSIAWGVLSRYVTEQPATWVEEVSSIAFASVVFVGAAEVERRGKHVRVDLLTVLLPARLRAIVELAAQGLLTLYCFYVAWLGLRQAIAARGAATSMLNIPLSVPYGLLTLGFFLFGLRSAQRLFATRGI
jgi:TRAP-type transport system small permease protein